MSAPRPDNSVAKLENGLADDKNSGENNYCYLETLVNHLLRCVLDNNKRVQEVFSYNI